MAGMRMAWSGQCDECFALYTIAPSDETEQVEQETISTTWPRQGECMVEDCEGTVEWNGNDPIGWVLARESSGSQTEGADRG